jgi:MoaA/NifB/PqqE/SkfB family radical SAM enzyme
MKSDLFYNNPNLSLVLPGPCQAKCDFCFWYQKKTAKDWMERLEYTLDNLPDCFYQISITGGEPTLSPFLLPVLDAVEKRRNKYKKIVMTTNAIKLYDYVDRVAQVVDHVNISRHHWLQEENEKVFKTKNIPNDLALGVYAGELKNKLTFNCVIKDISVEDMHTYLKYAKDLGVNNICFRQEHGSLNSVTIERYLLGNYAKTGEGGCPVCRSSYFDFDGMNVGIKYSILEPKDVIDGIYELILHADGKLTSDWEAKVEVKLEGAVHAN